MKKFLLMAAAALISVSAMAIDKVQKKTTTREITSVEELASATFQLTNADGQVMYTPSGWDIKVIASDQFTGNDQGGFYKLEAYDGHWLIPVYQNADGTTRRTFWAGNAYVNSQPVGGNVIFGLSGTNDQHGQDGKDLAVWDITYSEGNGFAFHCVGRDIYIGYDASAARPVDNIVYWTATGKVNQYDAAEVANAYNEVNGLNMQASVKTALEAAKSAYDAAPSFGKLTTYGDAVNAAIVSSEKLAITVGDDITSFLKNPSFDTSDLSAWTFANGVMPTVNNTFHNCEFYEKNFDMKQTISGLKKGTYEIGMQAFQRPGFPSDALADAFLNGTWTSCATLYTTAMETAVPHACTEMQDEKVSGSDSQMKGKWIPNSMEGAKAWFDAGYYKTTAKAVVTENGGSLTFGFKGQEPTGGWILFDNFTLTYISEDVMVDAAESDKLLAKVPTGKMDIVVKTTLDNAVSALEADKTNGTLYNELKNAISEAEASIEFYASIEKLYNSYYEKIEIFGEPAKDVWYDDEVVSQMGVNAMNGTLDKSYDYATKIAAVYNACVEAQKEYLKGDYTPVTDVTPLASATWVGQSGTVAQQYCPDMPGAPERYKDGAFTGDVMTQTLTGLKKGTYRVTMKGGASYTSGRGFEGATGQNHAFFFANDALQSMEVYDRTSIAAGTLDEAVLTCGVKEDGILKIGIQNITVGANWFVINLDKIEYISTDLPPVDATLAVGSAQWSTFIAPFEVTVPAGVTAYTVDGFSEKFADGSAVLEMNAITTIPANTPVVLNAESPVNETVSGVSQAEGMNYTVGLLTGVYADLEITDGYVLQNQSEKGIGFYAVDGAKTVPANHAYLTAPAAGVKAFTFGEATAIKALESLTAGKAQIFDMNGRQINKLQKGINIVNGVKVLVK